MDTEKVDQRNFIDFKANLGWLLFQLILAISKNEKSVCIYRARFNISMQYNKTPSISPLSTRGRYYLESR